MPAPPLAPLPVAHLYWARLCARGHTRCWGTVVPCTPRESAVGNQCELLQNAVSAVKEEHTVLWENRTEEFSLDQGDPEESNCCWQWMDEENSDRWRWTQMCSTPSICQGLRTISEQMSSEGKASASVEGPAEQWVSSTASAPGTQSHSFCFAPAESEGFPSQEHACFSMSASKGTREQRVSVWSGRTPSLHLQAWGGLLRSAGHSASPLVGEGREGQRGALPSPSGLFLASLDDLLMSWVKDRRAAGGSRSRECHRAILSPPPSTDTLTLQLHTEQFPLKEPQELVKQLLRSWWAKLIRTGRRGWDTLSQQTPLPAQQPTVRAGDQQLPDAPWGGEDLNPISASQLLRPVPERCTHTPPPPKHLALKASGPSPQDPWA